jgi:hypothetical protein
VTSTDTFVIEGIKGDVANDEDDEDQNISAITLMTLMSIDTANGTANLTANGTTNSAAKLCIVCLSTSTGTTLPAITAMWLSKW